MALAIALIAIACILIGLGRAKVRGARGLQPKSRPRRRKNALGWSLMLVGLLFMIAGVVIWQ